MNLVYDFMRLFGLNERKNSRGWSDEQFHLHGNSAAITWFTIYDFFMNNSDKIYDENLDKFNAKFKKILSVEDSLNIQCKKERAIKMEM